MMTMMMMMMMKMMMMSTTNPFLSPVSCCYIPIKGLLSTYVVRAYLFPQQTFSYRSNTLGDK